MTPQPIAPQTPPPPCFGEHLPPVNPSKVRPENSWAEALKQIPPQDVK